ncbi:MAG: gamma-glutamyl-gamma-aminobutyrate hydrolase family protein [Alphaproteobacteria bacterium]|nr:gamma-glutamyl-gamma-aminobutyrate hydrolase family protein [Alphaproteobacteria bacterium]
MSDKVLLVVHSRTSDTGRVGRILGELGYTSDIRCPLHGDPLPDTMDGHVGAAIFGGPQSVSDRTTLPPIQAEIDWIPRVLESGKPFLGICLGAQMLAHALGGRVSRHPAEIHEIGYTTIRPTDEWRGVLDAPHVFYQWHCEGFEVPACAKLLATGDAFPNQAFRVDGNVYGLQFHPEVTKPIMARWISDSVNIHRPEAQPGEQQLVAAEIYDPPVEDWTRAFLEAWIGRSRRNSCAA